MKQHLYKLTPQSHGAIPARIGNEVPSWCNGA
jgi:hypothetical protein